MELLKGPRKNLKGENAGRPFGAVLAIDGEIVATGVNEIVHTHDLTAHAEMQALRAACRALRVPLDPPPLPLTKLAIGMDAAELYGA